MLFAHVTSRVEGDKHPNLLSEKGGQGFPYLVYMNAEGDVMGKPGDRSVEAFKTGAKHVQTYVDLKDKKDLSDADKARLLIAEVNLGKVELEAAEKRKAGLEGLSADDTKALEAALVDLRIVHTLKSSKDQSPAAAAEIGKTFYGWYQEGQRPNGAEAYQPFYMLIMRHGQTVKDAKAFEVGFTAMKKKYGHLPQARRFFDAQQKVLDQLKSGG